MGYEDMADERHDQNNVEEAEEKKGFISWVKNHKTELAMAGVGTAFCIATILGIKNKESLSQLFEDLKYDMEHGKPGTERWFNKADLEELKEARKLVHNDLMNPALDNEYRADCHDLLLKFDQKIGEKEWEGREPKGPAYHREHGYGLYKP
ncbi:hypothetical protein K160097B7_09940 [[Clostridium] hylemonae]|jgi:hypothetical protein